MKEEGTCKEGLGTEKELASGGGGGQQAPAGQGVLESEGTVCFSLSWGMIGKAGMNARNSVLLGLERLGVISGKAQQELPASGNSVKVMSHSQRTS